MLTSYHSSTVPRSQDTGQAIEERRKGGGGDGGWGWGGACTRADPSPVRMACHEGRITVRYIWDGSFRVAGLRFTECNLKALHSAGMSLGVRGEDFHLRLRTVMAGDELVPCFHVYGMAYGSAPPQLRREGEKRTVT